MCVDPVTATLIASTVVSVAGTALSTSSAVQQQKYQARVAEQNAKLDAESAHDALVRGDTEAAKYQRQLSQQQGAQRASLAANNIDASFGSAAAVQGDLAAFGQEDVATIQQNAGREGRGYDISSANYRAGAAANRQAASGALIKGVFDIGSTVLGAVKQNQTNQAARRAGK